MKRFLFSVLLALLSFGAFAVGTVTTTLSSVIPLSTGYVLFYPTTAITGQPGCATVHDRFVVEGTTTGGKEQVAALITAMFMGKTINYVGLGTCAVISGVETLDYAIINN